MNKNIWIILSLILLIGMGYFFLPKYKQMKALKLQNKELAEKILTLEENNHLLRTKIDSLKNDPVYLEKVAREELSMSQSDEIIYKFSSSENEEDEK